MAKNPIAIVFKLNNEVQEIKTDNMLKGLRELKLNAKQIKTAARLEVSYNEGKPFARMFNLPRLRRFIADDNFKKLVAKQFNGVFGIVVKDYI